MSGPVCFECCVADLSLQRLQAASAGFGTEQLAAVVEKAVPGARLLRAAAAEVVFRLPLASASTFPQVGPRQGDSLLPQLRQSRNRTRDLL
jgi:hypothetical protein